MFWALTKEPRVSKKTVERNNLDLCMNGILDAQRKQHPLFLKTLEQDLKMWN